MCVVCTRYQKHLTCQAFPQGIPDVIAWEFFDHRNPHLGDGGLLFVSDNSEAAKIILSVYENPGPLPLDQEKL